MRREHFVALVAAALVGAVLALGARVVLTAPDTALPWTVFGSGGGTSSSASYGLGATAGQPAIGASSSAAYQLGAGNSYGLADRDADAMPDTLDNCPAVSNASQTNSDGDTLGNACDNCPTTTNQDQANSDGDPFGDACDNCPSAATVWVVPPLDDDCDGFTSADEAAITTLPLVKCGVNAWPVDFDDNQTIDIGDVLTLKPDFGGTVPPASPRLDIDPSGLIDISDVLAIKPFFGASCT